MRFFLYFLVFIVLCSCSAMDFPLPNPSYPFRNVGYGSSGVSNAQVEREFQVLNANYKQNTKELLEVMMNESTGNKVAISMENTSSCNFVLSISGNGFFTKIPIGVGQTRGVVVNKGQYKLSAKVCSSVYDEVKQVQSNVSLKLRE